MKGCIWTVVIIGVIAAIAIPNLNRARKQAQGGATVANIRTLHAAMTTYHAQFDRYPASIDALAGGSGEGRANLIPAEFASGTMDGYHVTVQGGPSVYTINAEPLEAGSRTFYSDQTAVIRAEKGPEPATAASPKVD
jgi:type II secretory pathway pseudopilin PulG